MKKILFIYLYFFYSQAIYLLIVQIQKILLNELVNDAINKLADKNLNKEKKSNFV